MKIKFKDLNKKTQLFLALILVAIFTLIVVLSHFLFNESKESIRDTEEKGNGNEIKKDFEYEKIEFDYPNDEEIDEGLISILKKEKGIIEEEKSDNQKIEENEEVIDISSEEELKNEDSGVEVKLDSKYETVVENEQLAITIPHQKNQSNVVEGSEESISKGNEAIRDPFPPSKEINKDYEKNEAINKVIDVYKKEKGYEIFNRTSGENSFVVFKNGISTHSYNGEKLYVITDPSTLNEASLSISLLIDEKISNSRINSILNDMVKNFKTEVNENGVKFLFTSQNIQVSW